MNCDRRIHGFTLVEMLVAMGIFAIIAVISYSGLSQFLQNRDVLKQRTNQLHRLQTTMVLLEQDLRFATPRPVRDGFGDSEPVMIAGADNELSPGELLRFTTSRPNVELSPAQRLERVAWRLDNGSLTRVSWRILDRDQDSKEYSRVLLEDVKDLTVEYLRWSPETLSLERFSDWREDETLPTGVVLLLTLDDGKQYRRVLEISNGT